MYSAFIMSAPVSAADCEKIDICFFNFIHKCFLPAKYKLCELLT